MSDLTRTFFRLFLIQASFNYDRMIGIGMAHSMRPLVDEGDALVAGRSAQFFNAHPYMAGVAVGALARAERDDMSEAPVMALRNALVGALGSIGDRLIWAGALPVAAGVGLALAARLDPVVGAVTFLVLYNVVHLTLRWWGLRVGWTYGLQVATVLARGSIKTGLSLAGPLAGITLGVAIPMVANALTADLARAETMGAAVVAGTAIVVSRWVSPSLGGVRFGLVVAGLALIAGAVWA